MDEIIHANLRNLRNSKGISQSQLAKELGVSQSLIGMWEGTRVPPKGQLQVLADYYKVRVADLFFEGMDNTDVETIIEKIRRLRYEDQLLIRTLVDRMNSH